MISQGDAPKKIPAQQRNQKSTTGGLRLARDQIEHDHAQRDALLLVARCSRLIDPPETAPIRAKGQRGLGHVQSFDQLRAAADPA